MQPVNLFDLAALRETARFANAQQLAIPVGGVTDQAGIAAGFMKRDLQFGLGEQPINRMAVVGGEERFNNGLADEVAKFALWGRLL